MKYLIAFLGIITCTIVSAQESIPANTTINNEVKVLIEQYAKYTSFTTDNQAISLDYLHKFGGLFYDSGDECIFMDIDPVNLLIEPVNADDYSDFVKKNYPKGISVSIDLNNLKISDAYQYKKKNTYRCNVLLTKNIFGLYQGKQIHDFAEKMAIQVIFNKDKNELVNFKIYKIETAKNAEDISKKKELKFAMGLVALPQQSSIYSTNMGSNEYLSVSNNVTVGGGIGISIKASKNINIITGVLYNSYSSTYAIKGYNQTSTESFVDQDNDTYYAEATADYEDECIQTNIQVPVNIEYVFNPASKLRFYAYAGAAFSYAISTQYNVKGSATTRGYYEKYNVVLEDIPEYGFETKTYDESGHWSLSQMNFLANVGGGIMLPTGLKSVMKLGPNYSLSLNDLAYSESKFTGDYFSIIGDPGKTGVSGLGFMWSMLWYF